MKIPILFYFYKRLYSLSTLKCLPFFSFVFSFRFVLLETSSHSNTFIYTYTCICTYIYDISSFDIHAIGNVFVCAMCVQQTSYKYQSIAWNTSLRCEIHIALAANLDVFNQKTKKDAVATKSVRTFGIWGIWWREQTQFHFLKFISSWRDFTPIGERVRGTSFIPFKTPLHEVRKITKNIYFFWLLRPLPIRGKPILKNHLFPFRSGMYLCQTIKGKHRTNFLRFFFEKLNL